MAALASGAVGQRPFIVHFQGPWADESAAVGHGRLSVVVKRQLERAIYQRADRLITLSSAFKRMLVERYGIAPWRIDIIEPGVDVEWFTPGHRTTTRAFLSVPTEAWIAVTVRRLVPRMGIDGLLTTGCPPVDLR
jgi:glycosyltransferase involved in cell wall biosynthesis